MASMSSMAPMASVVSMAFMGHSRARLGPVGSPPWPPWPPHTDVLPSCSDLVDQSWDTMQLIEKTLCVFRQETHTQPPHTDVFPGFDRYLPQQPNTQTLFYFQTKTMPHLATSRRGGAATTTQHRLTFTSKQRQYLTWTPAGAAAPPQQPNTQTHLYFQTKTMPHLGTSRCGGAPTTTQHTDSLLLPSKDSASPRHQPARRSFLIKHA